MFANGDVTVNLKDCFAKTNTLGFTYSNHYVKEFPLYWESHGDKSTKERVPTQFTHDVTMVYSIRNGMLNFSLECHNLLDARVYDNYSLQKAGRAFYAKVRYSFGKYSLKKL